MCLFYVCIIFFLLYPNYFLFFFFLMIRRPPRSTLSSSSAASDVYKRQDLEEEELRGIIVSLQHDRDHVPPQPIVDEAQLRKHQSDLVALRAAYAKIDILEEQKTAAERALREALDNQSALSIDIQLLQKKLEIRTERIETLKRGLSESHDAYQRLENDSEEKHHRLRASMLDARSDAAHWREKYMAIKDGSESSHRPE
eukprot:TRINITY_DN50200_c0_g2_i2.p1 TRINITY_DN50200_c0_g2~~TRINITY_DN50200_c0_g2_i2.p1  ORF type:complete len:199 (+),score=24.34 TRINITY_DN50200_c0_g2_i2:1-597(+)